METDEGIFDAIVLLRRQFNTVLKRIDKMPRPNVKNMSFDISKNNDFQRKARNEEKPNQGKGIKCHSCEGFGHIRSECPTYLKKQKKGLSVSWYDDDDSEGELDDETTKHVTTFTGRCESNEDSWIEDVSYEELTDSYKELCTRSEEVCKIGEKQKRIITQLQAEEEKQLSTISSLQNEVTLLSSKVQNKTKFIRMLNNWSDMLDEILQVGKRTGNLKGIWFNYQSLNKLGKTPVTKFIPSKKEYELTMLDQMLQHPSRH